MHSEIAIDSYLFKSHTETSRSPVGKCVFTYVAKYTLGSTTNVNPLNNTVVMAISNLFLCSVTYHPCLL